MKEKIFAVVTMTLIPVAVIVNTIRMHSDIDAICDAVVKIEIGENTEEAKSDAVAAYELFQKKELFIGLTVNHEDLSNIENGFAEMIGYLTVDDSDSAEVTRNRLLDSLSHLRRLSGFNIDAII